MEIKRWPEFSPPDDCPHRERCVRASGCIQGAVLQTVLNEPDTSEKPRRVIIIMEDISCLGALDVLEQANTFLGQNP